MKVCIKTLMALVFFGVVAGLPSITRASGILYDCTITQKIERLYWISDKVGIVIRDGRSAVVSDAVILHFLEKPIETSQIRDKPGKLIVRWKLRGTQDSENQRAGVIEYTARINKKTGAFSLYAKPVGFSNRFSGKGACITKTEK